VTLGSRSLWLLDRCSRQLRKSCANANMVYSRAERVFILEHYFASKSFAAVREAFSNACPDKEVTHKTTVHWLVTTFRDTGSVCLWQVLIERQNSWNYGRTDFKQRISCSNGIGLLEFNRASGVGVLWLKGFMCSSYGCVLNGTPCINSEYLEKMCSTLVSQGPGGGGGNIKVSLKEAGYEDVNWICVTQDCV
jgi:hypothetical protein